MKIDYLEGLLEGFVAYDAAWVMTYVNSAGERILRRRREDVLGKTWHQAFPHAVGNPVDAMYQRVMRSRCAERMEYFYAHYGRWMEISASPLDDGGVGVYFQDITGRQALEHSERRYRAIFETAAVSIWEEDFTAVKAELDRLRACGVADLRRYLAEHPEFLQRLVGMVRIIDVNDATLRMFGAKDKKELLASLDRVFVPETAAIFADELVAIAEGRASLEAETVLRTLQGERRDVLFTMAFPLAGAPYDRVPVTLMDISDRKRAEEALRESETRFRTMADTAPAMLWITDAAGMATFLSRGWYELTGQTEAEALGLGWTNAAHPDDREEAARIFLAANEKREPFALQYRLRRRDGEYRWAVDAGRPRFSAAGEHLGYIGSVIDMHELRVAEEARRESDERFRAIFGQTNAGLAQTDLGGRFVLVNPTYCAIVGRGAAELYGMRMQDLTHPDDLPSNARLFERLAADGEPFTIEKRYRRPDGSEVWVSNYVSAIMGADGRPRSIVAVVQDVTERKRAEEALREADKRKDEFLATLSHELRNPLAPVANALQLLDHDGADAKALHGMMRRQIHHLVRLVDDLLEVSRITRGVLELRPARVDLATVVRNAVETSEHLIGAGGPRLSVSLPEEALWLDGDPVRLAQILANLLGNAARYTPPGGDISVRARRENAAVAISVRDNGAGISAAQLPRLFEMFSRGERSSGLGIGLALARGLAEMHGGTLEAASDGPGKGAEFTVRLPLAEAPAGQAAVRTHAPSGLAGLRILVVDDNRDAADSLGALLRHLGAEARVVHDGAGALEAFELCAPDAVLLDIGMPEMDGYEVARRIRGRADGARVALIALTGWGQEADRERARQAGFDHHLTKPADIGTLQALLAARLG